MQRRGSSGQPVKGQSANKPKARNAPTAQVATGDLQEQLDQRTRELEEALQQQTATSEVLSIFAGHRQMPNRFSMPSSRVLRGCAMPFSALSIC